MEEQSALYDVLPECSVCFEKLDVTSRVLPCQHTFCMRCLQQIIDARNELRCPECREHVPVRQVTELPTNILLVRILDGLNRPATIRPKSTSPPGTRSTKHSEVPGSSRGVFVKNSSSPQPCAKALYKYEAQEPMDLSFDKGDKISLRRKIDENWYQGELNGTVGFFPASYVQVLTPLPPEPPQCKALYDFEVNEQDDKDCLTFLKDEVLKVIRRIDENWVEGQRGDKIGIFPLSFVELNGSAKHLIDSQAPSADGSGSSHQSQGSGDADPGNQEASGSSKNKSSNKRHSFTSLLTQKSNKDAQSSSTNGASGGSSSSSNNRHSMEISSPVLVRSSNPTAANLIDNKASGGGGAAATAAAGPTGAAAGTAQGATGGTGRKKPAPLTISATAASNDRPPNSPTVTSPTSQAGVTIASLPMSPKPKVEVYVAMYSYKPQKADELELRKNEFYTVNEKCKDGWFKGMSLRTGELGVFPGNYMQPYRHDRPKKGSTTTASTEARSPSPQVSQPAGSPRLHMTTGVTTATTTSPTSQTAPTVRMRSPGTTPTNSAMTQTPLSGMTTSTSSTTLKAAAEGQGTQKRSQLIASDGQKTIAQLQRERAAQQMQYYSLPSSGQTQGQAGRQQGTSHGPTVPNRMPTSGHQDGPRGSPPTVGSQQTPVSPRTNATQQQTVTSRATLVSHTHSTQGSRTTAGVQRGTHSSVQTPNMAATGARTKTSAQLVAGSPPEQVSASQGMARSRNQSGSPVAVGVSEAASDGLSNGQTTVVSTAVLRSSPSNAAPSPGQQREKREKKTKRVPRPAQLPGDETGGNPATQVRTNSLPENQAPAAEESQQQRRSQNLDTTNEGIAVALEEGAVGGAVNGAIGVVERRDKPPKTTPLLRERYRVVVPYPPQSEAELELKIGDTVYVHNKRSDGWFKGTLERTGRTGLFPSTFVESY